MTDLFTVLPPGHKNNAQTPFSLVMDTWDDFGFKTQYTLYYNHASRVDASYIGSVKILLLGQLESPAGILKLGTHGRLGPEYCSLGQSLDYYERLKSVPASYREQITSGLNDIIAFPDRAKVFETDRGWKTSLMRDAPLDFRQTAAIIFHNDYDALPSEHLLLRFEAKGWDAPLILDFAAPNPDPMAFFERSGAESRYRLPKRITVLTGRNGTGKSTLLARLARVLYASPSERATETIKRLGQILPAGIGFTRIITVSYSGFDAFHLPGQTSADLKRLAADLEAGQGRYYFCGLRDIGREVRELVSDDDVPHEADRQKRTLLKELKIVAAEFGRTMGQIHNRGRLALFQQVAPILQADPSFVDIDLQALVSKPDEYTDAFMAWSTGHKIVMHTLATLVAYTERKSIILFDEPEIHLHPPLLASLMHAIRFILEERDAFGVIATHSPVVVQETMSRHVKIVRRVADQITITSPKIETFGESVGAITDEIFGLHADSTDFYGTLRRMVTAGNDLEAIEALFEKGMSLQARSYVMSLLYADDRTPDVET